MPYGFVMKIQSNAPSDKHQLMAWLQQNVPGYTYSLRGPTVIVGKGAATGVALAPKADGSVKLMWGFPSMASQLLLTLTIFLGLLPGLLLFLIVWLVVRNDVNMMKHQLAEALTSSAQVPAAAPVGVMPAPSPS